MPTGEEATRIGYVPQLRMCPRRDIDASELWALAAAWAEALGGTPQSYRVVVSADDPAVVEEWFRRAEPLYPRAWTFLLTSRDATSWDQIRALVSALPAYHILTLSARTSGNHDLRWSTYPIAPAPSAQVPLTAKIPEGVTASPATAGRQQWVAPGLPAAAWLATWADACESVADPTWWALQLEARPSEASAVAALGEKLRARRRIELEWRGFELKDPLAAWNGHAASAWREDPGAGASFFDLRIVPELVASALDLIALPDERLAEALLYQTVGPFGHLLKVGFLRGDPTLEAAMMDKPSYEALEATRKRLSVLSGADVVDYGQS